MSPCCSLARVPLRSHLTEGTRGRNFKQRRSGTTREVVSFQHLQSIDLYPWGFVIFWNAHKILQMLRVGGVCGLLRGKI